MKKEIILISILILILISYLFQDGIVNSFIASILFFAFPLLVGASIIGYIDRRLKLKLNFIFFFSICWALGMLILFTIAILLSLIFFKIWILSLLLIPFLYLGSKNMETFKIDRKKTLIYLVLILFALIIIILFKTYSPFPYSLAFDQTIYGFESDKIINNFSIFTNQLSETMHNLKYRPSMFALNLGLSSFLANISPFYSTWAFPFIMNLIFIILIFEFAIFLTKSRGASILISISSVMLFEHTNINGLRGLAPSSLLLLFLPAILFFILKEKANKKSIVIVYLWGLILAIIQPYEGLIVLLTISLSILLKKFESLRKIIYPLLILVGLYLILIITLSIMPKNIINFNFLGFNLLNWDWNFKLSLLDKWFTLPLILISLIGCLVSCLKKDEKMIILVANYLLLLLIFSFNISAIFRLALFMHLFVSIFITAPYIKIHLNKSLYLILILLTVFFISLPFLTYINYYQPKVSGGVFSSFSKAEIDSAEFLNKYSTKSALLIGEPEQTTTISAITGIEALGGRSPSKNDKSLIVNTLNGNFSDVKSYCPREIYIIDSFRANVWMDNLLNIYFPITSGKNVNKIAEDPIYQGSEGIEIYKLNC